MIKTPLMEDLVTLRRYAACLVGSDSEGDALVTELLERVLGGQVELDQSAGMRLALFRALHELWIVGELSVRAS